jgi:hypothetical protein
MLNESWLVEWESWFVCQYINWNLTFKVQMYLIFLYLYKFHVFLIGFIMLKVYLIDRVRVQSWSYGSWIYNYLCNQCTSPLMLWVRIRFDEVYLIQHYVIKFVSDLRQVSNFLWVLRFPQRYSNSGRPSVFLVYAIT